MALPEDIISALPENYRDHSIVKESADVASVVKMAIDSQKELGSRIRVPGPDADSEARSAFLTDLQAKVPGVTLIPGEDATDDARSAFYEALGRPKEPAGYSIESVNMPDGLPEDYTMPQEALDGFRKFAHEQGLTQKQFQASLEAELKVAADQHKAASQSTQEREAKLKEQFGAAEESKRNAALRAAEKFGGAEFANALRETGTPQEWMAWAQAGETFAERGSLDLTGRGPQTSSLAPDEAKRRMNEMQGNRDHAYHNRQHAGHSDALFEMYNLRLQASGNKPLTRSQFDGQFGRQGKFNSTQLGTATAEIGG